MSELQVRQEPLRIVPTAVATRPWRALGLEPLTSLVRRSTLEDVFLRLTGRRLED